MRPHAAQGAEPGGSAVLDAPARTIPFARPLLGEAEKRAVLGVLDGPTLTHGPKVRQFEAEFARFTGAEHAVAVASCAAAMHLAYVYLGIGPGDEVVVPAQTHVATAHAVEVCGAACVFVDSEPETGNLDLDQLEARVTGRTRALAVVHYLGMPVDLERVRAIAGRHHLFVVEDCALSLGACYRGTHTGLWGDVGCFSFYPVKHITTAEGGMVICRRPEVAEEIAPLRAFGIDPSTKWAKSSNAGPLRYRPCSGSFSTSRSFQPCVTTAMRSARR